MIILGAISVDSAVVFLAQRELVNAAQAAANDAASYGIDESAFRAGRGYVYDPVRVDEAIGRALATRNIAAGHRWSSDGTEIRVELDRSVTYVFAKAVPGVSDTTAVHATGAARLREATG